MLPAGKDYLRYTSIFPAHIEILISFCNLGNRYAKFGTLQVCANEFISMK
jgi:hypothetical protein